MFISFIAGFTLSSSEAPIWIFADLTLPFVPELLSFEVESQANTPGLTKTTEMFNFTTGVFDVLDTTSESFNTDSIVNVDLTDDIGLYVEGNSNAALARIGWRQTGFTLVFPWEARIDHVVWNLNL